jgi:ubiquinone/menaquinone biosynthesis C-methylase UbiE
MLRPYEFLLQEESMQTISAQFHKPTGVMGQVVGWVLAAENRDRNTWAVSLLDIQSHHRVLEIGFGPGLAIEAAARKAIVGMVAGIDHSEVMVKQASRRNSAAIREGRVDLRLGDPAAIPYESGFFNAVLAVNSFHMWDDQAKGLCEVQRVLKPGGKIVIVEQPVSGELEAQAEALRSELPAKLAQVGFRAARVETIQLKHKPVVAAIGTK